MQRTATEKENQEAVETILKAPAKFRNEAEEIDYAKVQDEFKLSINRTYVVKRRAEEELAKRARKKS